jgi:lipid-binding SYLF domain-containing protein
MHVVSEVGGDHRVARKAETCVLECNGVGRQIGIAERDLILLYSIELTKLQRGSVKVGGRSSCVSLAPFQDLG